MKSTQVTATNNQRFATYSCGSLCIAQGDNRMNFDIRNKKSVQEFKEIVGHTSDEVYRLLVEERKSPVYF